MSNSVFIRKAAAYVVPMLLFTIMMTAGSTPAEAAEDAPAFLGVVVQPIDHAEKKSLKITHGVKVVEVEAGSAAEKAGIQKDDAILSMDNRDILIPGDLISLVRTHKAGDRVSLILFRNGKEKKMTVQLGSRKALDEDMPLGKMGGRRGFPMQPRPWLGIELHAMSQELASYFQAKPEDGVLILEVEKDGPAAKGGLQAGDIIQQLDNERVRRPGDVSRVLNQLQCGQEVPVRIIRQGKTKKLNVTIGKGQWGKNLRFRFFRNEGDEPGESIFPIPHGLRNLHFRVPRHEDDIMKRRFPRRFHRDWKGSLFTERRQATI